MAIDILGLGISIDTSPLKWLSKAMNDVGKASSKMADDIDKSSTKTEKLGKTSSTLASQLKGLVGAYAGIAGIGALGRTVDDYTKFTAQLKLATNSQREFTDAYENSIAIAKSAQADIGAVGNTYSRLARSLSDLGASQTQISNVTETVALGLKVSGASAIEASNAMLQLSQAFAAGKLSGDEFRSMAENAPVLMRALADSIGVPVGQLKQMAADGKLTADVMANAFKNPALVASLRAQASEIKTISGEYQNLKNELTIAIGEFDKATGASKAIASGLKLISDNLNIVVPLLGGLAVALAGIYSASILKGIASVATGIGSIITVLSGPVGLVAALAAAGLAFLSFGKDATKGVDDALNKYKQMTEEVKKTSISAQYDDINAKIVEQTKVLAGAYKELERLEGKRKAISDHPAYAAAMQNITDKITEQRQIIVGATGKLAEFNDKVNEISKAGENLKPVAVVSPEDAKAAENFIEKIRKQAATFDDAKSSTLEYEASLLKFDGTQLSIVRSTLSQIAAQERLTELRKELASYTSDLTSIFELNQSEKDNVTVMQERLDLMVQLSPAMRQMAQDQIDLARANQDMADSIKQTNEVMAATQEYDDAAAARSKTFEDEYNKVIRETEDLNTAIITNDKERARKQIEIEHNRRVEQYALNKDWTQEEIDLAIEAENKRYEIAKQQTSATRDLVKELGLTFTSAFEDAIVAGKGLSDVLKGIAQDIIKLMARKMVTEPLMNSFSGIFDNIFGGFRADGGSVSAGTPYIVGERGAEMFVPSTSGTIIPNNKLNSGNQVNNVSITINDSGARQEQGNTTQMAKQIEAAVVKVLIDQKRQGGVYA